MILSFINIRKVPQIVLKKPGFTLGFLHFPPDLENVNEWKIIFYPIIELYLKVLLSCASNTVLHCRFFRWNCKQSKKENITSFICAVAANLL